MIVNENLQLLLNVGAITAEGPSWDEDDQVLYWVDIDGEKVHIYDPSTKKDKAIEVGQYVGSIVPRKSGGVIVAMHHGLYFLNTEDGKLDFVVDPEKDELNNRFNDGKCDISGRFFIGTMHFEEKEPTGSLYCLEPDHSIRTLLTNVTISNGIAWSPDNRIMYYIDSPTKRVDAFDYDVESGTISNRRTVVEIPDNSGVPDGMTSDSEGMLWVAHWGGWQVSRWDPYIGKQIDTIHVPAEMISSCVFGGDNLDELYITTARRGLSKKDLRKQPNAGGIFRIKVNVKGMPTYKYAG
ncbi:MAG: SMP-30/gluconolactonase/LRE family protein [Candidatus Parvarchaeota archaeon]|nr:SMP-30/gluconolactonase/LRE family protein [Candidatus Jingweiarchaeum tengchongense]